MLRQLSDGTEAIMLGPAELVPVGDQAAVGYVETAGSCVEPTSCPRRGIGIISGWVVSLAHDSSPIVIAAFVGNEGIAAGTPGQSRPNVAEAFGAESDANLGFRFEIWLGEVDAGEEIRVFALSGGTATELPFVQGQ